MKSGHGTKSVYLFGLSGLFLILLTLFESALLNLSLSAERLISILLLIVPGIIGIIYGVLGAIQKETKVWIAYLGIL